MEPYRNVHGTIPKCTWNHTEMYMGPYRNVHETIPKCTWDHTEMYMGPYRNVHGTIPRCTWHHTEMYMGPYRNVHGTIPKCTWDHTEMYMRPYRNVDKHLSTHVVPDLLTLIVPLRWRDLTNVINQSKDWRSLDVLDQVKHIISFTQQVGS